MMKKAIDEGLNGVNLDKTRQTEIWNRIQEMEHSGLEHDNPKNRLRKRPLRMLIVVCILIFALSALCIAAELPDKILSLFEPVNESSVYDGIELRVVSAVADDDSIMILYTMKDLKGSRISEFTSIYDYNLSSAATLGTYPVDYDAKTKTATFCMAGDNGNEMKGRKLTLSISSFLDGAPMELRETKLNVYDMLQRQSNRSGGPGFRDYNAEKEDSFWNAQNQNGSDLREEFVQKDQFPILEEGAMNLKIPGVDWITVTNVGYKDGWLHIQVKYDGKKSGFNHGYICLSDKKGTELENAILNSPLADGSEEFVIKAADLEDLKGTYLSGVLTNYDSLNSGKWETAFKVKGVETKSIACEVKTDSVMINKAVISPLGVTIYGKGEPEDKIRVHMREGSDIISEGFSCSGDGETGEFTCKYKFAEPLDIENIETIKLSGQEIAVP